MRVLMSVLYAARMARLDLLRAVGGLAQRVTKWTPECDKQLHRLMCYIHSTLHYRMVGWVGDTVDNTSIHLYADADFAGCKDTALSTTGVHVALQGLHTSYPLAGVFKKQDCVSHSTPEAEIVAAAWALRREGIPALQLWDILLQGKRGLYFHEDNQSMIRVCHTGCNPTMRHLNRTHGVCVYWLKQRFDEPVLRTYIQTSRRYLYQSF
jgi:hypothetical protein